MTISAPIDINHIEGWLVAIGFAPTRAIDPTLNWRLDVACPDPRTGPCRFMVGCPKERPDRAIIVLGSTVDPRQVAAFGELEEDEQAAFNFDLRDLMLNREHIDFLVQGGEGRACPTAFQISTLRYYDGLTLDSFARSINSVLKSQLAVFMFFQRRLAPKAKTGASMFGFERTSGVQ